MKKMLAVLVGLSCAGCVSVSEVIPVGKDTYTVSTEMSGKFPSWSEVKQFAMKRASEHCATTGRYMKKVIPITKNLGGPRAVP